MMPDAMMTIRFHKREDTVFGLKSNRRRFDPNDPAPVGPENERETSSRVKLTVFDMLGREVKVLVDGVLAAGVHTSAFNASSLASGMYIYRLDTPSASFSRKMVLLR